MVDSRWWGLGAACALVVACSATTEADDGPDDAGPVGVSRVDAGSDDVTPATQEDAAASTEDASEPEDAATDAAPPRDAGRDSGPVDASVPADADAAPASCQQDAVRCTGYVEEQCSLNVWAPIARSQACCHDRTRFRLEGNDIVLDTATGLRWWRTGGSEVSRIRAANHCATRITRLATAQELATLAIGVGTCSPAVDQVAFRTVLAAEHWTPTGDCTDMRTGVVAVCSGRQNGVLCIKD